MGNDDIDHIFDDYKFEDDKSKNKDVKKKAQKAFEKAVKKDKAKKEETFNSESKPKEVKEAKINSSVNNRGFEAIKTNPERIVLIGIIVCLSAFIVVDMLYFSQCECTNVIKEDSGKETPLITNNQTNKTNLNETISLNNKTHEEEESNETEEEPEEPELSGKVTLKIEKVYYEAIDDQKGKIDKIAFTIENGKEETLKPIVHAYIYDSSMEISWQTRSRGEYRYDSGIKSGKKHTGTLSLSPKYYHGLDLTRHVRLVLNSTKESFIDVETKDVVIS